jgi:hypothetical protein
LGAVERRTVDEGLPWARTWMGIAALAAVVGVLVATVGYSQGSVVVDGQVAVVDCAPPVTGAWGDELSPTEAELAAGTIDADCPGSGRERLAVAVTLVVAGVAGFVALQRRRRRSSVDADGE